MSRNDPRIPGEPDEAPPGLPAGEQRYRTLVESSPEPVYVLRDERIVYVNPAAIRMFRAASARELLGTSIFDRVQPDDRRPTADRLEDLAGGGTPSLVQRTFVALDGTTVDVDIQCTAIEYDGAPAVHVTAHDITARRRAETDLRASETKWRTLFSILPVGIAILQADHGVAEFNPALARILGTTSEKLHLGSYRQRQYLRSDGSPMPAGEYPSVLAVKERRVVPPLEIGVVKEDGDVIWTEVAAAPLQLPGFDCVVVTTDVTARKQAETALHLRSAALNATANAVVITDARGVIEWANAAFTTLTGYTLDEAAGRNPGDLLKSGRYDATYYRELWATILSGSVWRGELTNRRKDGSLYTEEMTITPLRGAQGEITHFIAVKQDVSQRKTLEEQFRQSQKLESVGRLAGGVAHDFNNMLGVILGHSDLAMLDTDPGHPLHAHLSEIQGAARRSADLTRQLLAFARQQSVEPRLLDLNDTIRGVLGMLQRMIGEDVELSWQPARDLWAVSIDPSQMDQILTNLCVNARDSISGVGTVVVATANCTLDSSFTATRPDATPGEYVRLSVTDTGSGMEPGVLAHVFEPFFTTKPVGMGTGLGLATVYGAVRQNLGFVSVSSTPGRGSTFDVYLPRHSHPTAPAPPVPETGPAPRGHETILVVEDEPALLSLATRVLEAQGYAVIGARGPFEAIQMARTHAGVIHLLLTDVVMPEMNGHDLADTLAVFLPRMKRLFMSGYSANVIARNGVIDDETHLIVKPFALAALAAKVRTVLDRG